MTRKHNKNPRSERAVRHPAMPQISLNDAENNLRLKENLLAASAAQLVGAEQKKQQAWHWGEVGFIEAMAAHEAIKIIDAVPLDLAAENYRHELRRQLAACIDEYRQCDSSDPDGYGMGTLYAILRDAGLSCD